VADSAAAPAVVVDLTAAVAAVDRTAAADVAKHSSLVLKFAALHSMQGRIIYGASIIRSIHRPPAFAPPDEGGVN
jgi:hypothetical protein